MQGHLRKRGNGWQVVIYLGVVNGKKKYKYQTFKKQKEAQKALTDLLYQINNNTFVDPGKITFGEYLERWLQDYCVPKLAPKTFKRYEEIIKLHVKPEIGNILLSKLSPINIQSYYTKALTQGRIGNKYRDKKGLSPTTVLQHHRIIHKALEQALKWQLVSRNVADAVEPPKKQKAEISVIEYSTFKTILNLIQEKYPVAWLPIVILGATGIRRAEACGIRWQDVSIKKGTICITKQIQRIDGELILRDTKNKKGRTIPIPTYLVDILKKHKVRQNEKILRSEEYQNNDLVCCWDDGRTIDPDYLTKVFINKACKKLGISARLHDLRHSFATFLLGKNVHPKIVQELLGHSSITITLDTYSHVIPSIAREVTELINSELEKVDCQEIVKEKKTGSS